MHTGKQYSTKEVLFWTRRHIYRLFFIALIPVALYQLLDWKAIALPWVVVALLGTAISFIVGFRNSQTYSRTWEARQIWGGIVNTSRAWGIFSRDFISNSNDAKILIYRHFAWLTAMRYQMRDKRSWENVDKQNNIEFREKAFSIPEMQTSIESELQKFLSAEELRYILSTKNRATQILSLQSKTLKELHEKGALETMKFLDLENLLKDLYDQQGKSERIKNFPYPRQFTTVSSMLVKLFSILLPFGLLNEFDKLNQAVKGVLHGQMVWFLIPFSLIVSWVFTTLDQVGESTENPFEGNANDVPITQICRVIEIDLREMIGETDLPPAIQPQNNIVL